MTTLLRALNAATDSLGPEHSAAVRQARAALRSAYLNMRTLVVGSTVIEAVDVLDMDALDGMVARWIEDMVSSLAKNSAAHAAVAHAIDGEPRLYRVE